MKQRSTTPVSIKGLVTKSVIVATAVMMSISSPVAMYKQVSADQYDEQINALQREIDSYQAQASELSKQAQTLQNEIQTIDGQKAAIQAQIKISQTRHDQLLQQIKDTVARIDLNKETLGDTLANMYADDGISPLEMLASSDSIGDYVDQQEYRSSVRDQLTTTIDEINRLKTELEEQKVAVERTLLDQKNAENALIAKEQEKAALLEQTRNDENAYSQLSADRQSKQLQVQQQQQDAIATAMRRAGGGGGISGSGQLGSYTSWAGDCYVDANAYSHGGAMGNGEDPLGYGCNQCVSYTAWKTMQVTGGSVVPSYWGNANMWPAKARAYGLKVTNEPRARALGVISAGVYGHIVYIENYNPATNTVDISQYNELINGRWGLYSTRTNQPASVYDTYIYL